MAVVLRTKSRQQCRIYVKSREQSTPASVDGLVLRNGAGVGWCHRAEPRPLDGERVFRHIFALAWVKLANRSPAIAAMCTCLEIALGCECTRLDAGEEDLAHQPVRHASRTPVSRDASKRSPERPPSLFFPLKARSSPAGALEQRWRALPRHRYGPLNPCSSGTNYLAKLAGRPSHSNLR